MQKATARSRRSKEQSEYPKEHDRYRVTSGCRRIDHRSAVLRGLWFVLIRSKDY